MSIQTLVRSTRTALTVTGLGTLASATYAVSAAYDLEATKPLDLLIEVNATTTGTPAGNKQVYVFAKVTLDGTNYSSGPESGTTATNEADLYAVGSVSMADTSAHGKTFSLFSALGFMPSSVKIIVKNDLGVALTAGTVFTSEITGNIA